MRISDWSSDVCSSDLVAARKSFLQRRNVGHVSGKPELDLAVVRRQYDIARPGHEGMTNLPPDLGADRNVLQIGEIGRASWRERVSQYVWISGGDVSLKKKKH